MCAYKNCVTEVSALIISAYVWKIGKNKFLNIWFTRHAKDVKTSSVFSQKSDGNGLALVSSLYISNRMSVCTKESRYPLNRYGSPLQCRISQMLGSFF